MNHQLEYKERFVVQNEWGKYLKMWKSEKYKLVKYKWLPQWHSCTVFGTVDHAKTELKLMKRPGRYQIIQIYLLD
jgi:hypothetical protein